MALIRLFIFAFKRTFDVLWVRVVWSQPGVRRLVIILHLMLTVLQREEQIVFGDFHAPCGETFLRVSLDPGLETQDRPQPVHSLTHTHTHTHTHLIPTSYTSLLKCKNPQMTVRGAAGVRSCSKSLQRVQTRRLSSGAAESAAACSSRMVGGGSLSFADVYLAIWP